MTSINQSHVLVYKLFISHSLPYVFSDAHYMDTIIVKMKT